MMKTKSKFQELAELNSKAFMYFVNENYSIEFNGYSKLFFEKPKERELIGVYFYNSLYDQPKKKACYQSFLERQEDTNPKSTVNALRFLKEMQLKSEFQCN